MRIIRYNDNMLDACAEFWWKIYEHMPYVHRPDGYQTINTPPIGPDPEYFVKHLKAGLGCRDTQHWEGEVTDDSIVLAVDGGKVEGILVSSIDREKHVANILSAYVQRDHRGREIADRLLTEALELFRKLELRRVVAAPGPSKSLEVECPIHLSLLDAGFAWENDWWPAFPKEVYGVFMGGSLEGFRLQPEIKEKIEQLSREGVMIERCTADQFRNLRLDMIRYRGHIPGQYGEKAASIYPFAGDVTYVALVDGLVVGWLTEVQTWVDAYGRVFGGAVPEVVPIYRRRGIGKVLYHLGIEEAVGQGAQYGWTSTGIYNPARLIYQSIGYRYWFTCFSRMLKRLR